MRIIKAFLLKGTYMTRIIIRLIFSISFLFAGVSSGAKINLVKNPSFEIEDSFDFSIYNKWRKQIADAIITLNRELSDK
jgi:hypothetical protein